jgi:hypothetical protein
MASPLRGVIYALLIGIDIYGHPLPNLAGCGNDVTAAAALLRVLLGDRLRLMELRDQAATRAAVISAIRGHLGRAGPGDAAFLWFSGHGSQAAVAPRFWHLEPTGMHQTLVCSDSRVDGVTDLTDKELSALISRVAARGAHVSVVLDCCHSGGGTRETDLRIRTVPAADEPIPENAYVPELRELAPGPVADDHVALSACRSFEKAAEQRTGGWIHGIFSASLMDALRLLGPSATYRELYAVARCRVENRTVLQTPVIHPVLPRSVADEPFLGGAAARPDTFTLSNVRGRWRVDAGSCHGILPVERGETVFAVAEGHPMAGSKLKMASVQPGSCEVNPIDWAPDKSRVHSVTIARRPAPAISVSVAEGPAGALVRKALAAQSDGAVALIPAGGQAPGLHVTASAKDLEIRRDDGSLVGERVPGQDENAAYVIAAQIGHIARWTLIKDLQNPGSLLTGLVDLEVVRATPGEALVPLTGRPLALNEVGEIELAYARTATGWEPPEIFIRIRNRSPMRLWCVLLNLTDRYRSHAALFPGAFVAPNHTAAAFEGRPVPVKLPASRPVEPGASVRDWCQLIVSDQEIPSLAFHLPPLEEAGLRKRDIGPTPSPPLAATWTTVLIPIRTVVPSSIAEASG